MQVIKGILIFLLSTFYINLSYSQSYIKGKVIDHKTQKALAFVNIIFNDNPYCGTTSDIDGKFSFKSAVKTNKLTCSYVGYEKQDLDLTSIDTQNELIIKLHSSPKILQEVIVKAGENPANRIIRKVIKNKDLNNPEKITSFKYTSYNKDIYDIIPHDTIADDSLNIRLKTFLKGGHAFFSESVTERKFMKPDINEEVVIATKVSGFKKPSFASIGTDMQPFSFYNNMITILDINYLNPIAKGSLKKYTFRIKDTLFHKNDSTYIISFKPKMNKNIDGLTGLLYINTNKYAIENVIAEPFEKGLIDIKIQQKYSLIDNKQWFPSQLNFELILRNDPSKRFVTTVNGKTYIEKVELFPELKRSDFSIDAVSIHKLANNRDSSFWVQHRTESLNTSEKTTYRVIDSIGKRYKFDAALLVVEKLADNKITFKFMDIDITKSLIYNQFEGMRLGLGAYTNDKVLKNLSVGGFFGYGLGDHQWKYGGEFALKLNRDKEIEIKGKHQHNLKEPGGLTLNSINTVNVFDTKIYFASQMDKIKQNSISIGFRTLKYAKFNFELNHTKVSPQYDYQFQPNELQTITNYTNCDIRIKLKFAYKEKFVNSLKKRMSVGTKYPVLLLSYTKGIKGLYNSEFNFNKIEARIEQSFLSKNIGKTTFRIDGGFIDKALPYGLLFTGEGSYDKNLPLFLANYFQTVRPYEFLSDRFVNIHFSHNFGSLLYKHGKFQPHISIHNNIGWGKLSHSEYHKNIEFKTKEKGLFETGVQIDNIIKANYLNLLYLGFGAGAYYRYGPYAHTNTNDNMTIKFSMTISTK
ncbi:DUF5686 family protein [Ancylomarina sp. 16SWW S1-10-2]|uniref:DUF5686 family protein n=1 Tax=Ancylomarina sp. 16SWW S1-10-2 TaxID=2499681 RepID=UPI0012ADBBBB|nr:DUF5686 family protein [Ancylomarina sp. 16SWW S1-10-2]MRT92628.1 carboxypeptidase-like regulatory domain-containing protein [Ancylomarina sp. 16SWW S1-10-2]